MGALLVRGYEIQQGRTACDADLTPLFAAADLGAVSADGRAWGARPAGQPRLATELAQRCAPPPRPAPA